MIFCLHQNPGRVSAVPSALWGGGCPALRSFVMPALPRRAPGWAGALRRRRPIQPPQVQVALVNTHWKILQLRQELSACFCSLDFVTAPVPAAAVPLVLLPRAACARQIVHFQACQVSIPLVPNSLLWLQWVSSSEEIQELSFYVRVCCCVQIHSLGHGSFPKTSIVKQV